MFQETAHFHADNLGVGCEYLRENNSAWVLVSLSLKVEKYPRWGDDIKIITWPSGRKWLFYFRDFKVVNGKNDLLCRAVTKWLVVDLKQKSPKRTDNKPGFDFTFIDSQFPNWRDEVEPPPKWLPVDSFRVDYNDLDLNRLFNNARFIERAFGLYTVDFIEHHYAGSLNVNFLNKAQFGEEIEVSIGAVSILSKVHSYIRQSDQKEVCRIGIKWEECR